MARVTLTLNIPDEIIARVIAENPGDFDDYSDDLWEDSQNAVLDEIRASFVPSDLLPQDGA